MYTIRYGAAVPDAEPEVIIAEPESEPESESESEPVTDADKDDDEDVDEEPLEVAKDRDNQRAVR